MEGQLSIRKFLCNILVHCPLKYQTVDFAHSHILISAMKAMAVIVVQMCHNLFYIVINRCVSIFASFPYRFIEILSVH